MGCFRLYKINTGLFSLVFGYVGKFSSEEIPGRDDVRLTWAEYLSGNAKTNEAGKIDIYLKWKSNKAVEHMGMRVELMDSEERTFATAVLYDLFSGGAGQEEDAVISVLLDSVMNGTYKTHYTLFCMDAYYQSVDIDCVRGLDIVVDHPKNEGEIQWVNSSWGNLQLPQIKMIRESGEKYDE